MKAGLKEKLAVRKFNTSAEFFVECVHIENTWCQINHAPEWHISIPSSFRHSETNIQTRSGCFPKMINIHEIDSQRSNQVDVHLVEFQQSESMSSILSAVAW